MKCVSPISIHDEVHDEYMLVPCGKCGACRQSRRADWSFRIAQELKDHISSWFVTLTYSDDNLVFSQHGFATLVKRDFQLFMKRLRQAQLEYSKAKIRYYAVGEYGTKTDRPHYHAILFSVDPQLVQELANIWTVGHVHVMPVSPANIHYLTKYHVNKDKDAQERVDMDTGEIVQVKEPEFTLMSRRPGIGANYVEKNEKFHLRNDANYVVNQGFKQRLPRYYKDKLFPGKVNVSRDLMRIEASKLSLESYKEEVARLNKLDLDDPDLYMIKRGLKNASLITRKGNDSGIF